MRDTWRALHDNKSMHMLQTPEKYPPSNLYIYIKEETKQTRLDRPPTGTVKSCIFSPFFPLKSASMYRVHYLKTMLHEQCVAGP